jgi:hypothetical protein
MTGRRDRRMNKNVVLTGDVKRSRDELTSRACQKACPDFRVSSDRSQQPRASSSGATNVYQENPREKNQLSEEDIRVAIPKLVITNVDDFVGAEMAKKDRRNKRKRN